MGSTRVSDDLKVGGMSSDCFNSLHTLQRPGVFLVSVSPTLYPCMLQIHALPRSPLGEQASMSSNYCFVDTHLKVCVVKYMTSGFDLHAQATEPQSRRY